MINKSEITCPNCGYKKTEVMSENTWCINRGLEENDHLHAIPRLADNHVARNGNIVRVYMGSTSSHFMPDNIESIRLGDTVYIHLTNFEQEWDVVYGLAIKGANNAELLVAPGVTKTLKWESTRTGIYPFYCTAFCSALHQEM